MAWNQFEHQIWKNFVDHKHQNSKSYALAVSSGMDSMALLECCLRLRPKSHFLVLHYHHGPTKNLQQKKYRDSSLNLIQQKVIDLARAGYQIEFNHETSIVDLVSENDFRKARHQFLRSFVREDRPLLIAHHQNDWLETMLLKMIRGTGFQGLKNFKMWNGKIFRPFLNVTKIQVQRYAQLRKVIWLDDPSNADDRYLRNWLRNQYLPALEKRKIGSLNNFSNSLKALIDVKTDSSTFELCFYNNNIIHGLDRKWYDLLNQKQQLQAIHLFIQFSANSLNQELDVTGRQLKEIHKRLDKNQKNLLFNVAGANWVINASQIMIQFNR